MRINNNFLEDVKKEKAMCQDLRDFMRNVISKEDDNQQNIPNLNILIQTASQIGIGLEPIDNPDYNGDFNNDNDYPNFL